MRRVLAFSLVGPFGHGDAVGEAQRLLKALGQPLGDALAHHDAVHDHVDVVLVGLLQRRGVLDRVVLAVDLQALEALPLPVGDFLAVLALAVAHHRREQEEPRAFRQVGDAVDHLADRLALDR